MGTPTGAGTDTAEPRADALAAGLICGSIALLACFYRDFLDWLAWNFSAGSLEAHCALVPLMAAGLAWFRRDDAARLMPSTSKVGLVLTAWAVVLGLLATAADSLVASGFSLVLAVHGMTLALVGPSLTRLMLEPIYFLLFMLPVRYPIEVFLGFPLRLFSSGLSQWMLELVGIPVQRAGTVLTVPGFTVQVGAPCSGLNILTALLMIAAFLAVARRLAPAAATLLLAFSLPAAMIANALRISAVAGIGSGFGAEAALGFLHGGSGMAAFGLSVVLVIGTGNLLARRWAETKPPLAAEPLQGMDATASVARSACHLLLLFGMAVAADTTLAAHRSPAPLPDLALFPRAVGQSTSQDESLQEDERLLQATTGGQIVRRVLKTADGRAVWLALVSAGASWRVHHPPEFCYMAQGWTVLENSPRAGADGGRFQELLAEKGEERRVVQYWFTDGRRSTPSLFARWLAALEAGFRGSVPAPWLMVTISSADRDVETLDALRPAVRQAAEGWLSRGPY